MVTPLLFFGASQGKRIKSDNFGIHARRISQNDPSNSRTPLYSEIGYKFIRLIEPPLCKWKNIEVTQGNYLWDDLDYMMDFIQSNGLTPYYVFGDTPNWAAVEVKTEGQIPRIDAYQSFTETLVNRFKGRGIHYELWNEMNTTKSFDGPEYHAIGMILGRSVALRAIDSTCKIYAPSVNDVGAGWTNRMLKSGAFENVDGISFHGYVGNNQPDTIPAIARSFKELKDRFNIPEVVNSEFTWNSFNLNYINQNYPTKMPSLMGASYLVWGMVMNHISGVDCTMFFGLDEDISTNANFSCIEMLEPTTKIKRNPAIALQYYINLVINGVIYNYQDNFPVRSVDLITENGTHGKIFRAADNYNYEINLLEFKSVVDILGNPITPVANYQLTPVCIYAFY